MRGRPRPAGAERQGEAEQVVVVAFFFVDVPGEPAAGQELAAGQADLAP